MGHTLSMDTKISTHDAGLLGSRANWTEKPGRVSGQVFREQSMYYFPKVPRESGVLKGLAGI